ncbi:hypothetical protein L6164_028409 [Bauhinia variegata]|uniref:Uncharacterized protein n=1 Tax=Bauhinia variegata TaxID=167791 RepID=A0ACB9L6E1_BAUVA|nr:hypothetical protein L6164_028409 [Bauhinia variegata]
MGIGIRPICSSHKSYAVTIHGRAIQTLVTSSRKVARRWIKNQLQIPSQQHQSELLVRLDSEWLPSYTPSDRKLVAIIQLCISKCCHIFQLHRASSVPESL